MGTVQAKGLDTSRRKDGPLRFKQVPLDQMPAKVRRVVVDGLGRTKNDIVVKEVKSIFSAGNFQEMVHRTHDVKVRFEKLGLFKSIKVMVDSVKDDATKDLYEVTFEVEEQKRVSGGINTLIGTNDASLLLGMKLPNMFGRGEKSIFEYSHGTKSNKGQNFTFFAPLHGNPDKIFSTGVYQSSMEYPWSGYIETSRGTSIDFTLPSAFGSHCLRLEGVWRDLRALSRTTSFTVREQAGHSLKSSLKHEFVKDTRDDPIIPRHGSLLKIINEYAGLGGNVEYLKNEIEFQGTKSLFFDCSVQMSLAGGIMKPLATNEELKINDRFFLGGPLTLRGFTLKGVGPHCDGNALGADTYWMSALHLYTPLPFRPGKGGFGELFRTHLFVNAGNLANLKLSDSPSDMLQGLKANYRMSYGGGIVLRMGRVARLELNYVIPFKVNQGDSVNPGLQFGIGFVFL
ncbi:sorting and assembly machinery component 50 homolog [Argonauta hians]